MVVLNPDSKQQEMILQENFLQLSLALVALLRKEGLKTESHLEGLPHFSQLGLEEKQTAIDRVKFYHDLCFDHVSEGQSLRDSKRLTWRALVKLGLSPGSNLLDRIESDDVIEVYNPDQVQIFRNLEFFDICSYTLEELFCIQWWRLFRRDEAVSGSIIKLVEDLYQRKYPDGAASPLPQHTVVECLSREKTNINFFMKFIGPLYKNKQIEAVICIEQAQLV